MAWAVVVDTVLDEQNEAPKIDVRRGMKYGKAKDGSAKSIMIAVRLEPSEAAAVEILCKRYRMSKSGIYRLAIQKLICASEE